ncbi:MAG: hypothetical protein IPN38_19180 [Flavobacteriales bacterium]|nr:hypothetical protein [Flavobacteriales bacterium]
MALRWRVTTLMVNYGSNNMMVFNISNPAAPSLSATIATGTAPRAVAVAGNYAYVLNQGSSNMMVFDISNPPHPALLPPSPLELNHVPWPSQVATPM